MAQTMHQQSEPYCQQSQLLALQVPPLAPSHLLLAGARLLGQLGEATRELRPSRPEVIEERHETEVPEFEGALAVDVDVLACNTER